MKHAAGFILYDTIAGARHYLLLRNAKHGTWGFPKGHRDGGEDDLACARRELAEETTIEAVTVDATFRRELVYDVETRRGPMTKKVVYFLAHHEGGDDAVTISDEHDEFRHLVAADAINCFQHENLRELIVAAEAHLETK